MVTAVRAMASLVMLAGFYLVALIQVGAVVALAIWLSTVVSGLVAVKLLLPLFAASIGAVAVALWKAVRAKPEPPGGLLLAPHDAPLLWDTVRELAGIVRTRMPDEIRLVPEVNAAVEEQSRMLGLVGGRRILYIGLPLLQGMSVDQIRAVLAHELGHYSRRDTRFAAVAYRGRLAIEGTISRIGRRNPVGWAFRGYSRLYLMVDNAVSRRQELVADQASVQVAGRTAAASALRELPVLTAARNFYLSRYVEDGWEAGFAPADLFGGFAELLAARRDELDELRETSPEDIGSRWDTHPPVAQRIAAMATATDPAGRRDDRPAAVLLPDIGAVGLRLQEIVVDPGKRTVLPWPQFTAAVLSAGMQRRADRLYRALARFTGTPDVGLPTLFDLVRAGRLGEFAEQFHPDATRREAAQRFAEPMSQLLYGAAVASGVLHWRHSWAGPAILVTPDDRPVSLDDIATLAVAPETVDEAASRLAELDIDPARGTLEQHRATATGSQLIAGLANVKVDDVSHDLLVLNRGFIFVSDPGKAEKGRERLRELVGSTPVSRLAEVHRFLPFEEIASATVTKRVPTRGALELHDGRTITVHETWDSELLADDSRKTLLKVLESFQRD